MLREQLTKFNCLMQDIERVYEDYAKSVGLTYMSFTVLSILYHADEPYTQKEICIQSHYTKQLVNVIIKGFRGQGYVDFVEVPSDRRNKYVQFTPKGLEYAASIMEPMAELEEKALGNLSEAERNLMLDMLERCCKGYQGLEV